MQCRTPRCTEEATQGKWCEPHAEFYARLRVELETGKNGNHGQRFVGSRCKIYDCSERRLPGSTICLRHARMAGEVK